MILFVVYMRAVKETVDGINQRNARAIWIVICSFLFVFLFFLWSRRRRGFTFVACCFVVVCRTGMREERGDGE